MSGLKSQLSSIVQLKVEEPLKSFPALDDAPVQTAGGLSGTSEQLTLRMLNYYFLLRLYFVATFCVVWRQRLAYLPSISPSKPFTPPKC